MTKTVEAVAMAIDPDASWGVTIDNSQYHKDRRNKARMLARRAIKAHTECEEGEPYLIWSNQHTAWWRPDSRGYCKDVTKAGLYSKAKAVGISSRGRDGWLTPHEIPDEIAVPVSTVPEAFQAMLSAQEKTDDN